MINISKIIKNNGLYIYAFFCTAIIILLTFFVVVPKIKEAFENKNDFINKQEILTQLQKKSARLISIKSDDTKQLLDEATIALPTEKNPVSILTSLDNLSIDSQIAIDNISFTPGSISTEAANLNKTVQSLTFNLSVKGEWENIQKLIDKFLNTRRLFDISNIDITFDSIDNKNLISNMTVLVYYLPSIIQIGNVQSELPDITPQEKEMLYRLSSIPNFSEKLLANISTTSSNLVQIGKNNLFIQE
jgi:hypothetical protein